MVEVIGQGGKLSAFMIVQCLLRYHMTNLTTLRLWLSFEPTLHVLHRLIFTNLNIFKTNIPHAIVASFLVRHPTITNLVLDACNAATATTFVACPLTSCHLLHIEQLTCPPKGCVWPLLSVVMPASPLYNLQVIQHTVQDSTFPLQDLFNFHCILTLSYLYYLHLNFDYTAPDFLQAISTAMPLLKTLRLVENKFLDSICSLVFKL